MHTVHGVARFIGALGDIIMQNVGDAHAQRVALGNRLVSFLFEFRNLCAQIGNFC